MEISSLLFRNRRMFALMSVLALALLSGCWKSEEKRIVDAEEKRYAFVKVGMTKQEVVTKLGEPASKGPLCYRWATEAGCDFSASLEVRFDDAGKISSVARSRESRD